MQIENEFILDIKILLSLARACTSLLTIFLLRLNEKKNREKNLSFFLDWFSAKKLTIKKIHHEEDHRNKPIIIQLDHVKLLCIHTQTHDDNGAVKNRSFSKMPSHI